MTSSSSLPLNIPRFCFANYPHARRLQVADTSHDPASVAQQANAQAVKLLQRLLRGRALQNTLSMGLANRRELVAELRTQAPPGLALAYRHTVRGFVFIFVLVCVQYWRGFRKRNLLLRFFISCFVLMLILFLGSGFYLGQYKYCKTFDALTLNSFFFFSPSS